MNTMIAKPGILLIVIALAAGSSSLLAQSLNSGLRGSTPLNEEGPAAPMTPMRNTSEKETRNYPEQPPVIPHFIEGYQIDINGNKCLPCPCPHRRIASTDGQRHPLHGSQRPVSRLRIAAPLLLHLVPRFRRMWWRLPSPTISLILIQC